LILWVALKTSNTPDNIAKMQSIVTCRLLLARSFKCSIAGSPSANGAQHKAPNNPRNLSILLESSIARYAAKAQTKNLDKFLSDFLSFDYFIFPNKNPSNTRLVGLMHIG
jgi:hypothetical protein